MIGWSCGPFHPAIGHALGIELALDGERVVSAELKTGYARRSLEQAIGERPWHTAPLLAGHLDPETSVFGEMAFCLAVEEVANLPVPRRAQTIRLILCELSRMVCCLSYLARMAKRVQAEAMFHFALRDREKVLDLFELLAGARFSLNFIRFGGVRADVTDGFIERVHDVCDLTLIRLKEYNDLFTYNHAFRRRAQGVGVIAAPAARTAGLSGPCARASGLETDLRRIAPYTGYQNLDFGSASSTASVEGDVHARVLAHLREISLSVSLLRQAIEGMPVGEFAAGEIPPSFTAPAGEAYSRIEGPRGVLGCHVTSDGGGAPVGVRFRSPTAALLGAFPGAVAGAALEDVALILNSLNPSLPEFDR